MLIANAGLDKHRAHGEKVKLNHLHISVPSAKDAAGFYEKFFGFKFAFSEDNGKMIFLKDSSGFLLALHDLAPEETVNLPPWHHFGFCVDSRDRVKQIYAELKSSGVQFARDLRVEETWANFYCWAPGPYRVEVSWDQGE